MKDPVVQVGSPVLRQIAKPVGKKELGSTELLKLIARMKKVLDKEKYGVAIAAPQVGESLQLFVVAGRAFSDPDEDDTDPEPQPDRAFINPELVRMSRKTREMSEGCLSVRGKYGAVVRHEKATVKAVDEYGKPFIYHGSGLLAHIFQHEVDHLNGILYIDKATKLVDDETGAGRSNKNKEEHIHD